MDVLEAKKVDLILTSPPYYGVGGCVKYFRHRIVWGVLQLNVHKKKKQRPEERWFQNQLFKYPELIGKGWEPFARELSLKDILKKLGEKLDRSNFRGMKRRPDLVFKKENALLVVEIMRPQDLADDDHAERIHTYQAFLSANSNAYEVKGILIADPPYHRGVQQKLDNLSNQVISLSWNKFLELSKPEFRFGQTSYLGHTLEQFTELLLPSQSSVYTIATS